MGIIRDRLSHAFNAFMGNESDNQSFKEMGASYSTRPSSRSRGYAMNDQSIIASINTRIAIDAAAIPLKHVMLDANERYAGTVKSGLNRCLTLEANIDQGGRAFRQDMVQTMLEKGVIAVVPVDTGMKPTPGGGFDIRTMRVGVIVAWYPRHVRIRLWNDEKGREEEVTLSKSVVAIIENPMHAVMNEKLSTLTRLIRKLAMLDSIDEQTSSGKLDLIVQLPYAVKSDTKRNQAETRRVDIEKQMTGSKYGIAYIDATEKITQLNRPAENNMLKQIEYLTAQLFYQLGITEEVMNGTASEAAMLNYYNRTIEPILAAIAEGLKRAFLTKTAITQGQSIEFYRDPFKLVPISQIADVIDKLSRNEVVTANEFRPILGFMPSTDPKADKLINSNMPQPEAEDLGELTPVPPGGNQLAIKQKT